MKIRDIINEMDSDRRKSMNAALSAIDAALSKNPNIDRRSPEQRKKDRDEMLAKRQAERDAEEKNRKPGPHDDKSRVWKKGFADGKEGRMDRRASDAYGPQIGEYEAGYAAGSKMKESVSEMSAGDVGSVAMPMGGMQKRSDMYNDDGTMKNGLEFDNLIGTKKSKSKKKNK
jgi:hypothetical protein